MGGKPLESRPRRQVRFVAPVRNERPLTSREIRAFVARSGVLVGFMGLVYWLGWKSPWARADLRVSVETPDAPAIAPAAPVPSSAPPQTLSAAGGNAPAARRDDKSASSRRDEDSEQPRRKRHRRRSDEDSAARD
jgi:hypothetical protein